MTADIEYHEGTAVVRLDDGGHGNPLNADSCAHLTASLRSAADHARAIVLTGSHGVFTAGGDLQLLTEWVDWEPADRSRVLEDGPQTVLRTLLHLPVPTVAAVNGAATGAGLDIALACDLRIGARTARLGASYVTVGVIPGDGGAWLLPRHVGMGTALDLLLTGRIVDADEARRIGILGRVVDDDELLPSALAAAEQMARHPAEAVTMIRRAVIEGAAQSLDDHLRTMSLMMASIAGSSAHRDAVRRLLESRR